MGIKSFLQHSWNAFRNRDPTQSYNSDITFTYNARPFQSVLSSQTERSIIAAVYNKIAVDVSSVKIMHARLDENDRYTEVIKSGLNECLTVSANIDQSGRAFVEDAVLSLLDEGCIALVPVDTDLDPYRTNSFDIKSIRVGRIVEWFPQHIRVNLYNDRTGSREDITVPKTFAAVVINPFYNIMNENNSTFKRLVNKLNALDAIDKQSASGKLDLIIQLPFAIKSELGQKRADERKKSIEGQLKNSPYGIAYIDAAEHVTQLNRPAENNLLQQIEYLTKMLFSQLGITEDVFNGVADEQAMLNYNNKTVEPLLAALCDAMNRTFLTKTARTQGQAVVYLRDPFKLVPVANIAEIADKFTRNEILSSNDIRSIIGYKPSSDPRADELRNKNLNASESDQLPKQLPDETEDEVENK